METEAMTTMVTTAVEVLVTDNNADYLAQIAQDVRMLLFSVVLFITVKTVYHIFWSILGFKDA